MNTWQWIITLTGGLATFAGTAIAIAKIIISKKIDNIVIEVERHDGQLKNMDARVRKLESFKDSGEVHIKNTKEDIKEIKQDIANLMKSFNEKFDKISDFMGKLNINFSKSISDLFNEFKKE